MDMKISKRDAALLIGLAGILIIVAVYYFLYMPLGEKQTALEAENATLQIRVDELQVMADNKEHYLSETARLTEESNAIMDQFPSDVREEDMVMLAVSLQNSAPWESVSLITLYPVEERYVIGQKQAEAAASEAAAAQAAAAEAAATDPEAAEAAATDPAATVPETVIATPGTDAATKILYREQAGITYQADYSGFKNSMSDIAAQGNRETIDSINAVYDITTGVLASTVNVNMYYITGTGKEYVSPQIPFIPQGTDNIFGTISLTDTGEGETAEEETESED